MSIYIVSAAVLYIALLHWEYAFIIKWKDSSYAWFGTIKNSNAIKGFPGGSAGKESTFNEADLGSIPLLGKSPGEGNGYPLQCSGLENSVNCIVHGVEKSQFHFQCHKHCFTYIES